MNNRERVPFYRATYSRETLTNRRKQIAGALAASELAVFIGAPATGAFDLFRQYNDFYYLTGTEVPHSYLSIEGGTGISTLFVEPLDERMERSEGPILSLSDRLYIREMTGIENVKPLLALNETCSRASKIYAANEYQEGRQACQDTLKHALHSQRKDPFDNRVTRQRMVLDQINSERGNDSHLEKILKDMRLYKDTEEVSWMTRAGAITAAAVNLAMQATKQGIYEYQLGAIAECVFLAAGAAGGGYRPIIAGGENIWNAHYFRNNSELQEGDLVIMDYAPDLHYYTSDIGRMWPVNGTYSAVQRELYGFVVEYHKILLSVIKPGLTPEEIHLNAKEKGERLVETWHWSKPIYKQAARDVLEFKGHCSHTVGMAVHDNGQYFGQPIKPGLAFALDPQMWIAEEQLYIRVEDTIVITAEGYINLTAEAALELDDVESLMKRAPEFDSLGV